MVGFPFVLGVDIGGTKIDARLFAVDDGQVADDPAWMLQEEAHYGLEPHVQQIAGIIEKAIAALRGKGVLGAIGIGSPGRFDAEGFIKPGTCPNLGLTAHEFDGANLRDAYQQQLSVLHAPAASIPLYVYNDANAMLAGMLNGIISGKIPPLADQHGRTVTAADLWGRSVALFGIGTGIGHAIVKFSGDARYRFITDGHASKLRLPIDPEDWVWIEKARGLLGSDAVVACADHTVRAEDAFRGPVLCALAEVPHGAAFGANDPLHEAVLAFGGKYMARTIALIYAGSNSDIEPANGWTAEEKQAAAETSLYLIGGGMGSSAVGASLIRHAAKTLAALQIPVRLAQVAYDNVAARAAAVMVPEPIYR